MRFALLLAGLSAAYGLASAARAQTTHDAQLWLNATVQGSVGRNLVYFVEVQPRIGEDVNRLQQLILRPAIGIKVSPAVTLYQGYAHIVLPRAGGPDGKEDRSFQQLSWTMGSVGPGTLSSRTRLEQRWLSGGDDMGLRLRQTARYAVPFGRGSDMAALASVEGFVALNDTDWGARAGFDQVRAFLGVELPLPGRSTVEAGYLNQIVNDPGDRARMNHVLSIGLFVRP